MKLMRIFFTAFIAICVLPIITVLAQAFGKNLLGSMLVHRRYSTQAPMFAFRYVKSKRMHNRGSVHPSRASRSTKASSKQVKIPDARLTVKPDE